MAAEKNRFECVVNCTRKSSFQTIKHNTHAVLSCFRLHTQVVSWNALLNYFANVIIMNLYVHVLFDCLFSFLLCSSLLFCWCHCSVSKIEIKCSIFHLFANKVKIECDFMYKYLISVNLFLLANELVGLLSLMSHIQKKICSTF